MSNFLEFFSFSNPNIRYVVLGVILLGALSALVGVFTFLRKKSLIGDAIAHSVLPGVCIGFMLAGNKNPYFLLGGAIIAGWISTWFIQLITNHSKIKQDAALGITLSVFFGVGILLLTVIQNSGNPNQAGLDHVIFGKAASIGKTDLLLFIIVGAVIISAILLFYRNFVLMSFDMTFAKSTGVPIKAMQFVLSTITVLAVATGIQAVGVILMAAMLIIPAASARFWSNNLKTILLIAAICGALAGLGGAYVSYLAPKMPTGPWIIISATALAVLSMFIAPQRGLLPRWIRRLDFKKKIIDENILKAFYHLGEANGDFYADINTTTLLAKRAFNAGELAKRLKALTRKKFIVQHGDLYALTETGKHEGQRIVKIHRLWEIYLSKYMNLAEDHLHPGAEAIEHIITPELEALLEKELDFPTTDPHQKEIPYKKLNPS